MFDSALVLLSTLIQAIMAKHSYADLRLSEAAENNHR